MLLGWSLRPLTPLEERAGFSAANRWLLQEQRPDTLVVVWPPALSRSVHALANGLSASDAVPLEPAKARTLTRFLVLGPRGVGAPPELADASQSERRHFEALDVLVLNYPVTERVRANLRDDLRAAQVALAGPTLNLPCTEPRPDGGWGCAGQPEWNYVGPASLQVEGKNWDCVWTHPRAGHTLRIDWGEHELGDRLVLEAALSDEAARTPQGATVEIKAGWVGGQEVVLLRNNAAGITSRQLATPRGQRARVWASVSAPLDGRRHLGINLRLVDQDPTIATDPRSQGGNP